MATASVLRAVVTADTAQASTRLAAFGRQVDTTATSGSRSLSRFQAAGVVAFAALGVGALKFGADSIKAYRESEEVLAQLQNTIKNTPGYSDAAAAAFQRQATALQNLTGYEDEAILSADNILVRFDLTQKQVQDLIPTVLDYARATGKTVPEAADLLGKALLGNTRAIKEIGIQYKATGDRTGDLARLQDDLKGKVEGAAEAFGKTSQGKIEIFRAKLNDLEETVGKALLPVVDAMVRGLSFLVNIFNALPGPVKSVATAAIALGVAFVGVGLALKTVRSALTGYGVQLGQATAETAAATTATEGLAVAEASLASAVAGPVTAGLVGMTIALVEANNAVNEQFAVLNKDIATVQQFGTATKQGKAAQAQFSDQIRETFGRLAGFNATAAEYRQRMLNAAGATARTTGALKDAQGAMLGAIYKANTLKGGVDRVANAMTAATAEARGLAGAIRNIPKTWQTDYYFIQHYVGGRRHNEAEGGMVNMAGGGQASPGILELTRPTMIAPGVRAGEGGREFVLPANARGAMWIKDAVREGLAEGVAQLADVMSMGSGDVYLDGFKVGQVAKRSDSLRGVRT